MRKRNDPPFFDKKGEQRGDGDHDKDFSGPGVVEFSLDLNTDQLRNMSAEEIETYLRREARMRQHRSAGR
jgi:hypothetical protein